MLHKATQLTGDAIVATDGPIGRVDDIYFDDEDWRVRYLVVNTGGWLGGRKVLISPDAIDRQHSSETEISVTLSRKQVEGSPGIEAHKPVSRQYEEIYARYYGYPFYWADMAPITPMPGALDRESERAVEDAERRAQQSHLRSGSEVIGNNIEAVDGPLGHVDLVVDTRNWVPGKKVLVAPKLVDDIEWSSARIRVHAPRDAIKAMPASL
jgi:sporulation protein YlmC with PRC-barrel domain